MRFWRVLRGLPANVRALGLVSLANDTASDMIVPLLPAFVTRSLGLGPEFLGALEGLAESTASLLKLASGWISDRIGKRKALALAGYGISNLVRPLIGLATAGWHVLLLRFGDRVGKGVRTSPRDALLAASVGPGERGLAFGFQRAMDNLGAAIGPLIAAGLLAVFPGRLRLVFLASIVPGLAVLYLLAVRVRELAPPEPELAAAAKPPARLAGGLPRGRFRVFLAAMLLFTLGNSSDVFLVLRAQDAGIELAAIPILWMVLSLVRAVAAAPGGAISDRIGRRASILAGWAIYAAAYAGFALASSRGQIWALFVFYGLYYGMVEGAERALVADLVPEAERGRAYGWFHLAIGIGALPASLLFGFLWKASGPGLAFGVGAALAAAAAVVLGLMIEGPRSAAEA